MKYNASKDNPHLGTTCWIRWNPAVDIVHSAAHRNALRWYEIPVDIFFVQFMCNVFRCLKRLSALTVVMFEGEEKGAEGLLALQRLYRLLTVVGTKKLDLSKCNCFFSSFGRLGLELHSFGLQVVLHRGLKIYQGIQVPLKLVHVGRLTRPKKEDTFWGRE